MAISVLYAPFEGPRWRLQEFARWRHRGSNTAATDEHTTGGVVVVVVVKNAMQLAAGGREEANSWTPQSATNLTKV